MQHLADSAKVARKTKMAKNALICLSCLRMADWDGTGRQTKKVVALGYELDMRGERGTCCSDDSPLGALAVGAELDVNMWGVAEMCCSEDRGA